MRKTLSLLLLLTLLLCACSAEALENNDYNGVSVTMPADDTVNGYRPEASGTEEAAASPPLASSSAASSAVKQREASAPRETQSEPETSSGDASEPFSGIYYANTKTKKFHRPDCGHAKRIKDENLYIADNRDEMIAQGYEPCRQCNP